MTKTPFQMWTDWAGARCSAHYPVKDMRWAKWMRALPYTVQIPSVIAKDVSYVVHLEKSVSEIARAPRSR